MSEYKTYHLADGHTFHCTVEGDKIPEVYGWVEDRNGKTVSGSAGWYRTPDPIKAAGMAENNFVKGCVQ